MVQRDRLVVVVFRPRLFRLRRRIQFFGCSSLPPTLGFSRIAARLVLAGGCDVVLRLRLHRGPAHAKVARKLSDSGKFRGCFQMIGSFAILASEAKMRFAIESECGVLALARCESCLCK